MVTRLKRGRAYTPKGIPSNSIWMRVDEEDAEISEIMITLFLDVRGS
jgi:hypothetical protein